MNPESQIEKTAAKKPSNVQKARKLFAEIDEQVNTMLEEVLDTMSRGPLEDGTWQGQFGMIDMFGVNNALCNAHLPKDFNAAGSTGRLASDIVLWKLNMLCQREFQGQFKKYCAHYVNYVLSVEPLFPALEFVRGTKERRAHAQLPAPKTNEADVFFRRLSAIEIMDMQDELEMLREQVKELSSSKKGFFGSQTSTRITDGSGKKNDIDKAPLKSKFASSYFIAAFLGAVAMTVLQSAFEAADHVKERRETRKLPEEVQSLREEVNGLKQLTFSLDNADFSKASSVYGEFERLRRLEHIRKLQQEISTRVARLLPEQQLTK